MNTTWQLVEFDYPIALAALGIMVLGTLVLSMVVRKEIALGLMFIKVTIVVVYFCGFADGAWFYGGDDTGIFERGMQLASTGRSPITIWTHHHTAYLARSRDSLILIYLHNYLAIYFMGAYYYAPILLNVLLTSVTVACLAKVIRNICDDPRYVTYFVIFASLHWSVLAWSSFLNLKGPTVTCLLSIALLAITNMPRNMVANCMALLATLYLMTKVRFYFPAFVLGGLAIERLSIVWGNFPSYKVVLLLISGVIVVAYIVDSEIVLFFKMSNFIRFPYEFLHFILQPMPWRITEPASYLFLPSILHWIMFVPTIIGGLMIWRIHRTGRVIVGIVVAGAMFYGLVSAIASTRHRMPFDIVIIVMQYHFIWHVFVTTNNRSLRNRKWYIGKTS